MSTAVRSVLSRSIRRIECHAYITSPHRRHTCQVAYTISKDVRHLLTSLIGTARLDRVGSPHQPVSPVLSRHRRNGDERCTWRMERRRPDARTALDGQHLRAGWPQHSASPPTPTTATFISERR